MKKLVSLLLILALFFSFSACTPIEADPIPTLQPSESATWPTAPGETTLPPQSSLPGDLSLDPDGSYDTKEEVALYIHLYGKLPGNFMTKAEARAKGWKGGALHLTVPGKCIGGDRFYNREGLLPNAPGRYYTECDIGTLASSSRGAKRIVFSNDGLVYYTQNHYGSFELLYGEP